jgi:hypothetical protein
MEPRIAAVAGDGYPGLGMGGSWVCHLCLPAVDALVNRDQPGMRPGYPPVLHRPDIAAPHWRPIQEAGPIQAAYHNEVIAMTAARG